MAFDLDSAEAVAPTKKASGGFDLDSAELVSDSDYGHEGTKSPRQERKERSFAGKAMDLLNPVKGARGVGEAALAAASGVPAAVAGGLSGIGKAGYNLARGKGVSDSLADAGGTARHVTEALTYEPRSEEGKRVHEAVNLPMEIASRLLGGGGEAAGGLIGPDAAAAGRTIGENALPMAAAMSGGRALVGKAERPPVAGTDYTPTRQFSMEENARFQRQKGQGVEPTLGSVTRDPAQVRFENQTAGTERGRPLYQRSVENDAALEKHVAGLKEQPDIKGSRDINAADTGRSVRSAVEAKKAAADQRVNEAYDKARAAGETKAEVDVTPLVKYLRDNEPAAISVKQLKSISAGLRKLMGVEEDTGPAAIGSGKISGRIQKPKKEPETPKVTIDDLEFLRQEAGKLMQADGSVKSYMGDIRQIVDKITAGKGGNLYKEARALRRQVGKEFEDQSGVANIIDKKSATDYKVAGEDVWHKTVISGSTDDLINVIKTLRTTERNQAPQSMQALKDMQARTVDMITQEATKGDVFSPAGFERAIKTIGEEKLDILLGKDAVKTLQDALQTAKDLKKPPHRVTGSDTELNRSIKADMEKQATRIMQGVLPRPFNYVAKGVDYLREGAARRATARAEQAQVDDALTPGRASTAEIQAQRSRDLRERRKARMGDASRVIAPETVATGRDDRDDR